MSRRRNQWEYFLTPETGGCRIDLEPTFLLPDEARGPIDRTTPPEGSSMTLPDVIEDEAQLEEILTRPSEALVDGLRGFSGTIAVLGIGGKMGSTVGVRLRRALDAAGGAARVVGGARL